MIRPAVELLEGIPSVIYGLSGVTWSGGLAVSDYRHFIYQTFLQADRGLYYRAF
ncbi:MAG: hypothetical protein ACOCNB_09310 [Acetivibrio ethanolgignens]